MSFNIRDDFRAGAPISQVPANWFNSVARFINGLVGGFGVEMRKSDSGTSTVALDRQVLLGEIENATQGQKVSWETGAPDDRTDAETDDDTDGGTWTWTAGGADGLTLDCYCKAELSDGWHYLCRARLTFSRDGLLVKAEGLSGRRRIEG